MPLDLLYFEICCRAWSAESRTKNFILIGHSVAEILDIKVWKISNSGCNFLVISVFSKDLAWLICKFNFPHHTGYDDLAVYTAKMAGQPTLKGDQSLRRYINEPLNKCTLLAMETNGSVFNVNEISRKGWQEVCSVWDKNVQSVVCYRTNWLKFMGYFFEPIKDLRGNLKTRVSSDRTGPEPVRIGTHFWEHFGVGLGQDNDFGSVRVGVFFTIVSWEFRNYRGIKWKSCLAFSTWVSTARYRTLISML